jgi:hypothetical protein
VQDAEPVWLVAFHTRGSAVHPATTFQTVPPSTAERNATVPAGAPWLSEPGVVIDTVAVDVNAWPDTELGDDRSTDALVCARFTTWVTGMADVDP